MILEGRCNAKINYSGFKDSLVFLDRYSMTYGTEIMKD